MKARLPQGYGGGMGSMMKQAQKMQEDMAVLQEQLKVKEYAAAVGGGVVEATVNGEHRVVNLKLEPEVVDPGDVDMLCDLVTAAVNEAISKAEEDSNVEMAKITGGIDLPGLV